MSDKPIAALLTAIALAPLCLVCALGPAAFVAAAGGFLAWLASVGLPLIASVLAIGTWLSGRVLRSASSGATKGPGSVMRVAGIERAR